MYPIFEGILDGIAAATEQQQEYSAGERRDFGIRSDLDHQVRRIVPKDRGDRVSGAAGKVVDALRDVADAAEGLNRKQKNDIADCLRHAGERMLEQ